MSMKQVLPAVLLTIGLMGSVNESLAQPMPEPLSPQMPQTTAGIQDQQFVTLAGQANLTEIMSSQLALQKSANPQVRSLATKLVQDHTQANTSLALAAQRLELTLPKTPDATQQSMITQLSALSGPSFDAAYVQQMLQAHQEALILYQSELAQTRVPELKVYASTYLPELETHRASLQQQLIALQQPPSQPPQATGALGSIDSNPTSITGPAMDDETVPSQEQSTQTPSKGQSSVRGFW